MKTKEEIIKYLRELANDLKAYSEYGHQISIGEVIDYLEDHQVLQPLPSEMPKDLLDKWTDRTKNYGVSNLWYDIVLKYGTPTKKELPSVEELESEISRLRVIDLYTSKDIAKHIIDTYSLNTPKCDEFPFNLKKGDKLMSQGFVKTFGSISKPLVLFEDGGNNYADQCTPYQEPSIHDKFMASLSEESKKLYEQLKEVKG